MCLIWSNSFQDLYYSNLFHKTLNYENVLGMSYKSREEQIEDDLALKKHFNSNSPLIIMQICK